MADNKLSESDTMVNSRRYGSKGKDSNSKKSFCNIKEMDNFAEPIGFHWNNNDNFKTPCGGCFRILLILLMAFVFYYYGEQFVLAKNPNLVSSVLQEFPEKNDS